MNTDVLYDVCVIGGGINGVGIARDAAGQHIKVLLLEQGDLAGQTSSASTKLIHGGLRYLEQYDFKLVRESLLEREILLRAAPHIVRPMRFVLPHGKGLRPQWMIKAGLGLYDMLAGKSKLPKSEALDFHDIEEGQVLRDEYKRGFAYSDCWVDDARLVVLNAVDAAEKGADIKTRHRVKALRVEDKAWTVVADDILGRQDVIFRAKTVVNAAGPWVSEILRLAKLDEAAPKIRLVQGSHIVVPKLYHGSHSFLLQQPDKRVVFAIPYEGKYTLIGTTEVTFEDHRQKPFITGQEIDYLCQAACLYFKTDVKREDIIWTYSGVRPLFDDGSNDPRTVTRDYRFHHNHIDGAFMLSVFGGKLTTYRHLSEKAVEDVMDFLGKAPRHWTEYELLPGGDIITVDALVFDLVGQYKFLTVDLARRYARAYGSRTHRLLQDGALGHCYGDDLYEVEVRYLLSQEWAVSAEDILWRRSKLGLHVSHTTQENLKRDIPRLIQEIKGYDIITVAGH